MVEHSSKPGTHVGCDFLNLDIQFGTFKHHLECLPRLGPPPTLGPRLGHSLHIQYSCLLRQGHSPDLECSPRLRYLNTLRSPKLLTSTLYISWLLSKHDHTLLKACSCYAGQEISPFKRTMLMRPIWLGVCLKVETWSQFSIRRSCELRSTVPSLVTNFNSLDIIFYLLHNACELVAHSKSWLTNIIHSTQFVAACTRILVLWNRWRITFCDEF